MARILSAIFTQIVMVMGILHLLRVNDQNVQVTKELVQQHEEQRRQEMALLREMEQSSQEEPKFTLWSLVLPLHLLWVNDQNVQVTKELVQQHEEQRRQEMALLREMEQRSQEEPKFTLWSLVLPVCRCCSFWVAERMLIKVVRFYWQLRHGSCGSNSSAQGETPAAPRRKRRRRRKKTMNATAECGEQLDEVSSPDLRLEWNDMQNSEEEGIKEGMMEASATPSPQETLGQNCVQGIH